MRWISLVIIGASCTLGISVAAASAPPAEQAKLAPLAAGPILKQRLQKRLEELRREGFEGVVRIDLGDETLLSAAVGDADPISGRPFKMSTQVDMGSIAKPFTAMAILKLQEQGKLSVKDPVSRFLPNVPADKAGITLEHLLTHTAGFRSALGSDFERISRDEFEKRALASPLSSPPGKKYNYSNVGFGLLAAVIERVSGQSYEQYLTKNILKPGGATHTGYGSVANGGDIAADAKGRPVTTASWGGTPQWNLIGGGGLLTTAGDMVSFLKAFQKGKVISRASVIEAVHPRVKEGETGFTSYGYGLTVAQHPVLGKDVWHNGGNPFFSSEFHLLWDRDLVMFAAGNSFVRAPEVLMNLAAAMFGVDTAQPTLLQSPDGQLAAELRAKLTSPESDVREFIEKRFADDGVKKRLGTDGVLKIFDKARDKLSSATFERMQRGEPGTVLLLYRRPGKRRLEHVELVLEPGPQWKVGELRLPD